MLSIDIFTLEFGPGAKLLMPNFRTIDFALDAMQSQKTVTTFL